MVSSISNIELRYDVVKCITGYYKGRNKIIFNHFKRFPKQSHTLFLRAKLSTYLYFQKYVMDKIVHGM